MTTYWGGEGPDDFIGDDSPDALYGNGGDDTLVGSDGNDFLQGGAGADTLDGGDGIDTVDYNGIAGVTVDLGTGVGYGGEAEGDQIRDVENVWGTDGYGDFLTGSAVDNVLSGWGGNDTLSGQDGNDTLFGGAGNDVLQGGAGSDDLDGGDGIDTIDYSFSNADVRVDLNSHHGYDGEAEGDTLFNIENVWGSGWNDILGGSGGDNVMNGWAGDDSLGGLSGNDVLLGGQGDDQLYGGDGTDTLYSDGTFLSIPGSDSDHLYGGDGDDHLFADNGTDVLDGGDGNDTVDYSYDFRADTEFSIWVDLTSGTATWDGGAGDRLVSIENVVGAWTNDTLLGSAVANVLWGSYGNDHLFGDDGNDTLIGGDQDDFLQGGAGADMLVGGDGVDTIDYNGDAAVTVDLSGGHGHGGEAEGDTISGVENVQGTDGFGDILTGSAANNVLSGWGGNDGLYGLDGNDTLRGMVGNDVLVGGAGADTLSGGAGADRFVFGYADDSRVGAGDVIVDFSHAEGDTIMLSPIDANATIAGDQAFTFIGAAGFTGHAGELNESAADGVTTVSGDIDGDRVADFQITLSGAIALTAGDFVL